MLLTTFLLGRLWLFDNNLIHGGHKNTYVFKHKGPNLTLTQLPQHTCLKFKSEKEREKRLFMTEIQVEKAISKSKALFVLLMVESNTTEVVKPIHPVAQSLLKEFDDVFPNDLPQGSLP